MITINNVPLKYDAAHLYIKRKLQELTKLTLHFITIRKTHRLSI